MAPDGPDIRPAVTRLLTQGWVKPLLWVILVVIGIPSWAAVCFGLWWLLVGLSGGSMFGR